MTAHLACYYFKKCLNKESGEALSDMKLKALSSLVVASKFLEIDDNIPSVRSMIKSLNSDVKLDYESVMNV